MLISECPGHEKRGTDLTSILEEKALENRRREDKREGQNVLAHISVIIQNTRHNEQNVVSTGCLKKMYPLANIPITPSILDEGIWTYHR